MNSYKEKLIGALIGIARATDGNEHLISAESTAFIRECLSAEPEREDDFRPLMSRAEQIKRSMVPDCFLCANPCGRTAEFDLAELNSLDPASRDSKNRLLEMLIRIAESGRGEDSLFYRGLIVIGMEDYPESDLQQMLLEANDSMQA